MFRGRRRLSRRRLSRESVLKIAVVFVPDAEHEQEHEHDYDSLLSRRENKEPEKTLHRFA